MPQSAKDYFTKLFKDAGYDDARVTAALASFDDKVLPQFDVLVKTATDDYQAQLGRVRAAEEKVKQYDNWYGTASTQYQTVVNELETLKTRLGGITNGNGNGTGDLPPGFDPNKYLTKDDLAKVISDQGTRYAATIKEVGRLASRHAAKFSEELDVDAVEKIAVDQNVPLSVAYDKYVEPRMKEKEQKDRKDWEARRTEEIATDLRTRYKLPVEPVVPEASPIFSKPDKDAHPPTDQELLDVWQGRTK